MRIKSSSDLKTAILSALALSSLIVGCSSGTGRFIYRCQSELGLQPDSVAMTADMAAMVWNTTPWAKEFGRTVFEEYVLPPRIADEPVEYWWRQDIPVRLGLEAEPIDDILSLSRKINSRIHVPVQPDTWGNPQMGYSMTIAGNLGKCDDRSILLAMALRSYGIPAAFDYVPNWGRKNNGHSFCSVIRPDGSPYVFQGREDDGTEVVFSDIPPKIYRRTFFEQKDNPIYRRRGKESIPDQFMDCRFKDVTVCHNVSCRDISLDIDYTPGNRLAYLAVFNPQGWVPVAYGEIKGRKAEFRNVGTDILYLPCIYDGNTFVPVSDPVIVRNDNIEKVTTGGRTEEVILKRKYPRSDRIVMFAGYMDGGVFEAADNADFSDAEQLFRIDGIPFSRMQAKECVTECRYVRYRKPAGVFSIGEMKFRDCKGNELRGRIVFPSGFEGLPGMENVTDGDPLTYLELTGLTDVWIGVDFGETVRIGSIEFCPRTDDNDISPGDCYELLFWSDSGWESIGITRAEDYELYFSGVPSGALLWLRNITKGKEERPFLYESGAQRWL